MDRYVLEEFHVPFTSIENKDVRAADLRSRFDTIVLPSQDVDAIVNGHAAGTMPPDMPAASRSTASPRCARS